MVWGNSRDYLLKSGRVTSRKQIPNAGGCGLANLITLIITLFFSFEPVISQSNSVPVASGIGAVGAYSKNFVSPLSVLSNKASLTNIHTFSTALYCERRFMLKELAFFDAVVCIPFQFGGIALSLKRFGYQQYNQSQLGICYGKNLGRFDLGVQFSYHMINIPAYGTAGLLMFDIAGILHISENLYTGLQISNPTRSRFGTDKPERFPSRYSAGLGYEASGNLFIVGELVKEEGKTLQVNASLQYALAKQFFATLGIQTTGLHFGLGWKWNIFRVDITGSYDLRLGLTPGILILFEGKKKAA